MVDQQRQKDTADVRCKRGEQRPYKSPDQYPDKGVSECDRKTSSSEQAEEVVKAHPCKEFCRRHMLLVVICKRYQYQDQQRYRCKDHDSRNRKREQRFVKVLIPVSIEVLEECIDMFSSLRHLLQLIGVFDIGDPDQQKYNPDNNTDYRKQKNHK